MFPCMAFIKYVISFIVETSKFGPKFGFTFIDYNGNMHRPYYSCILWMRPNLNPKTPMFEDLKENEIVNPQNVEVCEDLTITLLVPRLI